MKILVTGAAGFIGFHLVERLIKLDHQITGIDNINDYYDVKLKYSRLKELGIQESDATAFLKECVSSRNENLSFIRMNMEDKVNLNKLFKKNSFDIVVNLAAQAGVRNSIDNPEVYIQSNIIAFANLLECCRHHDIKHLIYASSSSVYGQSKKVPFSVEDDVDRPISLYAATKKSNELMAYTYSHLYGFKTTGLRFFTVYGPWGRPDMAMFLFTDAIINNRPIKVFNNGDLQRDFTYISDIIDGVLKIMEENIAKEDDQGYSLYNIGNSHPVKLLDFIHEIEKNLNLKAEKIMMPMQPGDVSKTWADVSSLQRKYNYQPQVSIKEGISKFTKWYTEYYV